MTVCFASAPPTFQEAVHQPTPQGTELPPQIWWSVPLASGDDFRMWMLCYYRLISNSTTRTGEAITSRETEMIYPAVR